MYEKFQLLIIEDELYYCSSGNEVVFFSVVMKCKFFMIFKGLMGCGKIWFVEYMVWCFKLFFVMMVCNEDMMVFDFVGCWFFDVEGM